MAQYVYTMHRVGKVVPPKRHILKTSPELLPWGKIGVLGLNGAGKSTLLRIMAGIDTDIEGKRARNRASRSVICRRSRSLTSNTPCVNRWKKRWRKWSAR